MTDATAREAILDAATDLFARQGLEATSIKAIGEAAGVNPALLYYYYADKATLYEAVIDRMVAALPGRLAAALEGAESPAAGLAMAIRHQAEAFIANPLLPRLLARELADHEASHATPRIREQVARVLAGITRLIRAGQEAGEIRRDLDPPYIALSVLSQVNWYCIAAPVVEVVLQREGAGRDPAQVRAFADHVVRFSMAALEPEREVA